MIIVESPSKTRLWFSTYYPLVDFQYSLTEIERQRIEVL